MGQGKGGAINRRGHADITTMFEFTKRTVGGRHNEDESVTELRAMEQQ